MPDAALQIESVSKRYGAHVAVDRLSLKVPSGTIFGLLGPNGAGKTTTLRMINDILVADEGEIRILGRHRPGRQAAPHIGYLPEERGLYPKMKVIEVLRFFGELKGLSGKEAVRRSEKWLDRLELLDRKDAKVQDFSKGMQQKVQFITAVLHEPEILILDEPWSGLDPINADVLLDITLEQKKAGRTILFSTHLMDSAERLCDEVCIIARGRKVAEGSVRDLKRQGARDRTVAIGFASMEDQRAAGGILTDRSLVLDHREKDEVVLAELADGAVAQALLERLVGSGARLRRFELVEPSLHQIFVERVKGTTTPKEAARG